MCKCDARFVRIAGKRQTSGKVVTCKVDEGNARFDCYVLDDLVVTISQGPRHYQPPSLASRSLGPLVVSWNFFCIFPSSPRCSSSLASGRLHVITTRKNRPQSTSIAECIWMHHGAFQQATTTSERLAERLPAGLARFNFSRLPGNATA
jgi:hypothetical protein